MLAFSCWWDEALRWFLPEIITGLVLGAVVALAIRVRLGRDRKPPAFARPHGPDSPPPTPPRSKQPQPRLRVIPWLFPGLWVFWLLLAGSILYEFQISVNSCAPVESTLASVCTAMDTYQARYGGYNAISTAGSGSNPAPATGGDPIAFFSLQIRDSHDRYIHFRFGTVTADTYVCYAYPQYAGDRYVFSGDEAGIIRRQSQTQVPRPPGVPPLRPASETPMTGDAFAECVLLFCLAGLLLTPIWWVLTAWVSRRCSRPHRRR